MSQMAPALANARQSKPNGANAQGVALSKPGKPRYADFGKRLTYYMSEKGVDPGQLKAMLRVKQSSTISRWRSGKAKPDGPDLLRLAEAIGIEVNLLDPGFAPPEARWSLGDTRKGGMVAEPAVAYARAGGAEIGRGPMPPDLIVREIDRIAGELGRLLAEASKVLSMLTVLRAQIPAVRSSPAEGEGEVRRQQFEELHERQPPQQQPHQPEAKGREAGGRR